MPRHPDLGEGEVFAIEMSQIFIVFGDNGVHVLNPEQAMSDLEILSD